MRIISGTHKGRRLTAPSQLPVRPTTDLAKESLFNILNNYIDFEQTKALDLFSGIGSISFELASRKCKSVYTVDIHPDCIQFIKSYAEKLDMKNLFSCRQDAFSYIKSCKQKFDLIFADPPYQLKELASIPEAIFQADILEKEGYFVLEHARDHNFSTLPYFKEERKYGKVHFSFFQKSV